MNSSQNKENNKKDFGCNVKHIRKNILLGKDLVIHKKNIDLNIPHNLNNSKLLKNKNIKYLDLIISPHLNLIINSSEKQ